MAVFQISRIQIRRGRKLDQTGFPQLASGELGWAIDTQELYIGNGAVSEGSPYVGNSKILTEHDDLLELSTLYQYKKKDPSIQTGASVAHPIQRSLQQRLDDTVTSVSFGTKANGQDDDTRALQRAIDYLFLNDFTKLSPDGKVVLYLGPGVYRITDELRIPPYAHIVGAGIDSTIIYQTSSAAIMRMVDSNSTIGSYTDFASMNALDRPKYINIEGLTLQTDSDSYPIVYIDNAENTVFERVKFFGVYQNGSSPMVNQVGVYLRGTSGVFCPDNVIFRSCIIEQTGYGVYSETDHENVSFLSTKFYRLYDGLNIGGGTFGALDTHVTDCFFDLVDRYGIYVKAGEGNVSSSNTYLNVGNNNQGYPNATYPVIRFDADNNHSIGDFFKRNSKMKNINIYGSVPYVPNVLNNSLNGDANGYRVNISETPAAAPFLRLPSYDSGTYVIDYVINKTTLGTAVRTGRLHITVNFGSSDYHINDDFSYTGNPNVENIKFSAGLNDFNSDAVTDTLEVYIFNPSGNGVGTLNYSYNFLTK